VTDWLPRSVFLLHLGSTLFMVGVIWFVQVIHYPLLSRIAPGDVPSYEQSHTRLAFWVVAPPMLAELATGFGLLWVRPAEVSLSLAAVGVGLLVVVWVSTQCVQVPCHERLSRAFDPAIHRRLVSTNWVRTAAWSLRGLLVLWMAWVALSRG